MQMTMSEPPSSFRVDAESLAQATLLASKLRESHLAAIEERGPDLIANLIRPLAEFSSKVSLLDISADVQDFGLVIYLATYTNSSVAALPIGSLEKRVPILPSLEVLKGVFQALRQSEGTPVFAPAGAVHISIIEARETFFQGLFSYLAARIAGVRANLGADAGTGNPGQWWTATTQTSDLSMYRAGTHAVRHPPTYINGLTKPPAPLSIFLPMGTLHLGADAGQGGDIVWDPSVVIVPSYTPTFNTKRF
jgi:hypothetical protein